MQPPMYDPEAVRPMWEELEAVAVKNLETPKEVDAVLAQGGTALVVVNSVCGCAAGNARPGVARALQHGKVPDHLAAVFAGVFRDAVDQARSHMAHVQPSSPLIALFKDGTPVHVLERRHIEQMNEADVAADLTRAFDEHCTRPGPSVPREEYDKMVHARQCGSTIPAPGGQFRSIL